MNDLKTRCVFVGAFQSSTRDGSVGGQIHACRSLIESRLSDYVDWILLDTSSRYSISSPIVIKLLRAILRITKYLYFILFKNIDSVLIFSSYGFSAIEKGVMVFIAKIFNKHTVLSYRSGLMLHDIERSKYFRRYIKITINRCDILMCQSDYWMQYYKAISDAPVEKFKVVKNWIDITSLDYSDMSSKSDDRIYIVFMGSLNRKKGVYDLIEMLDKYREDFKKTKFILCGGGPDINRIKNLIEKLELEYIVELKGWVNNSEKASILRGSDIHVLPSYFEGMPNSILEAMASGKPIVSTNVGAIPELVVDGETGYLTKPGDIESMKRVLLTLTNNNDLRNKMGKNAKKFVEKNHDINIIYKDIYHIINKKKLT